MNGNGQASEYGVARFVTGPGVGLLPIQNPRGGRRLDIYGPGRPVPQGVLTEQQVNHFLAHNLIERVDDKGNVDRYRVGEALSAIIACCADEEGSENWGRPRIAERLRANGFAFSNQTISLAIKRWQNPPVPEQD